MSLGLELGTDAVRSLRLRGDRLIARSVPSRYCLLADAEPVRELLDKSGLPYAVCDGQLALLGEAAVGSDGLFGRPSLPLLPEGRVPTNDPPARQIVAALVETLLPAPAAAGVLCGLVLPGGPEADGAEFLTHLVRLRGYIPEVVPAARAAALATLEGHRFTGLVLVMGSATVELSFVRGGRVVGATRIDEGTDAIDRDLASLEELYVFDAEGHRYRDEAQIRKTREDFAGTLAAPSGPREKRIAERYAGWIDALFAEASGETPGGRAPEAVPLVCVGGPTRIPGFQSFLAGRIAEATLPVEVTEIRVSDPELTLSRGALIHAELERAGAGGAMTRVA